MCLLLRFPAFPNFPAPSRSLLLLRANEDASGVLVARKSIIGKQRRVFLSRPKSRIFSEFSLLLFASWRLLN